MKTRNTKCLKCGTSCLTDRDFMTHACLEYQNPTTMSEASHTPAPWMIRPDELREGSFQIRHETPFHRDNMIVASVIARTVDNIAEEHGGSQEANAAFLVRAVNSFDEMLAIVKAIAESFNAGANQVYAEALAPHTDDETLKTWINKAIAKATGGK